MQSRGESLAPGAAELSTQARQTFEAVAFTMVEYVSAGQAEHVAGPGAPLKVPATQAVHVDPSPVYPARQKHEVAPSFELAPDVQEVQD